MGNTLRKIFPAGLIAVVLLTLQVMPSSGWVPGDESAIFGHTFDESSWYTTVTNRTKTNETVEFGVSYLNIEGDIQAFLVTLNSIESDNGDYGVLPYQMFGMHYYTKGGQEMFIGALLAFLTVWEDKDNNSVPGPGERFFYVVPFGASKVVNGTYPPTVTNHQVKTIGADHYQMGITYKNMYAIATENPLLTMVHRTGWVFAFSELTVTYDIELDRETGTLRTETYYTIGQMTALYAVILGIPIPSNDIQWTIPDNYGVGAVHFTTVFASNYRLIDNRTGAQLDTGRDQVVNGTMDLETGGVRAFSVGLRGEYDLENEISKTTVGKDMDAYNMIMKAKLNDLILVSWQLGFSAIVFAHMAYGLSEQVRANWATPGFLAADSTKAVGPKGFGSQAFWYGVFFPKWEGYRVVHDPVYTAYFGEPKDGEVPEEVVPTPGFALAAAVAVLIMVPVTLSVLTRRKRADH